MRKRLHLLFLLVSFTLLISACQLPNHYLIHPAQPPVNVISWNEDITNSPLLIHIEGARPRGAGPFPAVLVHPEADWLATDMRGILWDLASRGYLAVAADYQRLINGEYQRKMFVWRDDNDVTSALDYLLTLPETDKQRVATLGFSQGGVYSLLIAAHAADTVKAVVAYYPITDFEQWIDPSHQTNPLRGLVYRIIRWHFYKDSGAETEEMFKAILRHASPLNHAESIHAPVLLIHGENDTSAELDESKRLETRLRELGREVRLIVVPKGKHVFNFKDPELAQATWKETLAWLERYLGTDNKPE